MDAVTPSPRLSVTAVRLADAADLPLLEGIEAAAATRFDGVVDTSTWHSFPTGEERRRAGGILFAIGQPAVGFAHLTEVDGRPHLDELSVPPEHQGRGLGTSLLRAAMGWALDQGASELTLRTFADVPWNAPYYARHGFTELPEPHPPGLAALRDAEIAVGVGRAERRIAMVAALRDEPAPRHAVSVIPLREGPGGLEVFVQHRVATMDFAAGMVVFPGGRVDPPDAAAGDLIDLPAVLLAAHVDAWRDTDHEALGGGVVAARTVLATAARELREETGAEIDPARLLPWDDWVTPLDLPRRFDVRFLLLPVTAGESVAFTNTTTEARHSAWTSVTALVRDTEAGELALLPPTRAIVDELAALGSLAAVLGRAPGIRAVRHDLDQRRPRP